METRFRHQLKSHQAFNSAIMLGGGFDEDPTDEVEVTLYDRVEGIRDIANRPGQFNPVSHVVLNQTFSQPEPWVHSNLFPATFVSQILLGERGNPTFNDLGMLSLLIDPDESLEGPLLVLPSGEAASFTRAALDKALRQVPEIVSIANFLFELRDVKSLVPRLNGWKTLPEQFLNLEFGWIPLVADIKKLLTLVAQVNKRVEHLKKVNGRCVTISHMRKVKLVESDGPSSIAGPPANHSQIVVPHVAYKEAVVRQHLRVNYNLDLKGADAFLSAMCSALGLLNPLKIIWNAIPFSFAVDWVYNLGSLIDDLGHNEPFTGTITIQDAFCSAKTKELGDIWMPHMTSTLGPNSMQKYSSYLVRSFHRRPGTLEGTIEVTGLTPFQQALAAALIASQANFRFPTRRRKPRV